MKKVLVLALSLFILTACENKDSYMKDFNSFIENVQNKSDQFSESDWKKADDQFSKFTGSTYTKYAEELSMEEKLAIAKYQATYAAMRAKSGVKGVGESLKNLGKSVKDASKKLEDTSKKIEDALK